MYESGTYNLRQNLGRSACAVACSATKLFNTAFNLPLQLQLQLNIRFAPELEMCKLLSVKEYSYDSVCFRTVTTVFARPTNEHLACIFVVHRGFRVTTPHSGHIQATAMWPHSCNNQAKFVVQIPTLFQEYFHNLKL